METITQLSVDQKLDRLRALLIARMLQKGGGAIPQSQRSAASEMGLTNPTLSRFLDASTDHLDVSTCIRLAKYLNAPVVTVLRLAGHDDIAAILGETQAAKATAAPAEVVHDDPWVLQFAQAIDDLDTEGRNTVLNNARSLARIIRKANTPTIIGGNDEEETKLQAKPYHIRGKRKKE